MSWLIDALARLGNGLARLKLTFGLREAILVSIAGIAITFAAAWHYGT